MQSLQLKIPLYRSKPHNRQQHYNYMKKIPIVLSMLLVAAACTVEEDFTGTPGGNQDLYYTPEGGADEDISLGLFDVIDLDYPGLEQVKESYEAGDYYYAAYYLLDYYRNRSNVSNPGVDASIMNPSASDSDRNMADQALKANGYRFYVRNYAESTDEATGLDIYYSFADADGNIDWETAPESIGDDQEWRSQKHRLQWMLPQARAYRATGNEDYIDSWKTVYKDWLDTYPCPEEVSSSDLPWYGLQPAERAIDQVSIMQYYLQSENFTPEWLSVFLTAFAQTVNCVMENPYTNPSDEEEAHNITLTQQKALFMAGVLLPELKDAQKWLSASSTTISTMIESQFNSDGVLNELDPSYHIGTVANYYDIIRVADANNLSSLLPANMTDYLANACRFVMDIIYPNYSLDNFNDTRSVSWSKSVLTRNLRQYLEMFPNDDELRWMATEGASGTMPASHVQTYPVSGYYMLRTGWTAGDMMLVLKNNDNAKDSWHCQPDNGTFTLYRNGRRFSPDAGCYTYNDGPDRETYRRANMHNTMTKPNGAIDNTLGKFLYQGSGRNYEVVVTENPSYDDLTFRRAVFLVDNSFYVLVDEGYGTYEGAVNLHFKGGNNDTKDAGSDMFVLDNVPSSSNSSEAVSEGTAVGMHTVYTDTNNMLFTTVPETHDGYKAWWNTQKFSDKIDTALRRKVYRIELDKAADKAARFITVIYPYGAASEFDSIEISARFTDNAEGQEGTFHANGASVEVTVNGTAYPLSYTLN